LFITADAFALPARRNGHNNTLYPNRWEYTGDGRMTFVINNKPIGGVMSESNYDTTVKPFVDVPGGQMATLVSNLVAAGVDKDVIVAYSPGIPRGIPFGVIWSDATHTPEEISANVPPMLDVLNLLPPGDCLTLAFHDIMKNPDPLPKTVGKHGDRGGPQSQINKVLDSARSGDRSCKVVGERMAAGAIYAVTLRC
jgi:hypothetical protein